tara:strand:+ start:167 stop:475 length:309 start_codon:yes stop_codon:yes gene_type:complete
MAIDKKELEEMNGLVSQGVKISEVAEKYPNYSYWEIYWEVSDYSFMGKKRMLTNRINSLAKSNKSSDREEIAEQAKALLNELYDSLKNNSKKLIEIDRVLRK